MKPFYVRRLFTSVFSLVLMAFPLCSYSQSSCFSSNLSPSNTFTAIWPLDGTTSDVSGNSNNQTGGTGPSSYSATAISGQAAYFNGISGGIQYSNGLFMTDVISKLSWGAWIKPDNLSSTMMLFDEGGATNGISVFLNASGELVFAVKEGANGDATLKVPFPTDGNYHHVSFTYDGADSGLLLVSLDGIVVGSRSFSNIGNIVAHNDGGGLAQQFGTSAASGLFPSTTFLPYKGFIDESYYAKNVIHYGNILQYVHCLGYSAFTSLPCSSDAFMSQKSTSEWISINLVTGNSTSSTPDGYNIEVNAIGYNELDGLVYGIANGSTQSFITVSQIAPGAGNYTYKTVQVGYIPELAGLNLLVGDIYNGKYYVREGSTNKVFEIDVNPSSPTYLQLLRTITLGSTISNLFDWAFTNDGKLFGVNTNGNLYQFDLTAATATLVASNVVPSGDSYGAAYFDNGDFLYVYNNSTGKVYRIDIAGGIYKGVVFSTAVSGLDLNDGARCANAAIPLDFGDAPDASTASVGIGTGPNQYQTMLSNNGPRHYVNILIPLRLGSSVTLESDGKPTPLADGDTDNGVSTFPDIAGGPSFSLASYSVNVSVTNAGTVAASVYGWIDWNSDGVFQIGERASATVPANTVNGNVTLTWNNVTLGGANGTAGTFARFRISTDAAAAEPTGGAADGEVEDYYVPYLLPLPVRLTKFTATVKNESVLLQWQTSSEKDNTGFSVERSTNTINWSEIAFVASSAKDGNTSSISNYSLIDDAVSGGYYYYRLRQIDKNGTYSYSQTRSANLLTSKINVSPNPASHFIKVSATTGATSVTLSTISGIELSRTKVVSDITNIDVSRLGSGIYLLRVFYADECLLSTKVVISR